MNIIVLQVFLIAHTRSSKKKNEMQYLRAHAIVEQLYMDTVAATI